MIMSAAVQLKISTAASPPATTEMFGHFAELLCFERTLKVVDGIVLKPEVKFDHLSGQGRPVL